MKTRKPMKRPIHPVLRVVITINCNYVKPDLLNVVQETIASGQFPCEIAFSDTEIMYYLFTKTRWSPGYNITLLMAQDDDRTRVVFQAVHEQAVETFDDDSCPISAEQWEDLGVVDWQFFRKVLYTLANMAFIDLKQELAGTQTQCLYGGDMTWLRAFLLKKVREPSPKIMKQEYEEFKRRMRDQIQRLKHPKKETRARERP